MITTLALWFLLGNWWSSFLVDSGLLETSMQFKKTQFLNVIISASLYLIWILLHYVYIQATHIEIETSQLLEQKLLISQVELQTIKASVHPHFMYNSLGLLANLALIEPEKVHKICVQMADFLRYSVNYAKREWVTLGEEIDHINNYLNIERERFGNRLQVSLQLADALRELHVIPLILFPLIENCIKHGISTTTDTGYIYVEIQRTQEQIIITIKNSLDPEGTTIQSTRLGLQSLKKRLSVSYGATAKLTTQTDQQQFGVTLTLPILANSKTITVT
jgi:LytS/YehU family sensor histidine kinase